MTDLVKRLREIGAHYSACDRQQTIYEAADALEAAQAQAAEVRREAVARIIMENRDDGACHVKNWAGEERDNPHVAQALRQADAVLAAIRALTDAAKGDRT